MTEARRLEFTEPIGPFPLVAIGYHVCPDGHADSYPLKVLEEIMAGGQSGRVNKRLVKEQGATLPRPLSFGCALRFPGRRR